MLGEYKLNEIYNKDSLEFLKERADYEFDINYSDPPYALGSEVIIRPDGKVDYKKANDFMNKWEMPTGEYWEQWFKEAYRTLKHGGYCIMFGMDRQLLLFKYYANLAGFEEQQSLYWYFISNFPKATDLSKMIDKNAGAEREIIGTKKGVGSNKTDSMKNGLGESQEFASEYDNTKPSTDLAKKYDGYKYSISPLKQTNETIMVFRKPYKSGSCLHDTLAFENGDNECRCGALNIDGNRVPSETPISIHNAPKGTFAGGEQNRGSDTESYREQDGRYPSQTFCDSNTAEVLDKQSGISKSTIRISEDKDNVKNTFGLGRTGITPRGHNDTGGCSKILHKCNYEQDDYDLYFYNPKVSKSERNAGCDGEPQQYSHDGRETPIENPYQRNKSVAINNHPTLKPIALNEKILKLFKTPNDDKIVFPFAGAGSEVIGGIKAGFKNWVGCEINPDYINIAKARIDYALNKYEYDFKKELEEVKETGQQSIFDLLGVD